MKKILTLLMLLCAVFTGAWAQNFTSVSTTKTTSAHSGFYVLDVCDQQSDDNHHYLRDGAQNTATTGSFGTDTTLPGISDATFKKYVWYVSPTGNGTYTFRNLGTGKYLNIATGSSNGQALTLTSTMYGVHFDFSGEYAALGNGNNQWYDAASAGTGTTTWSGGVGGSRRIRVYKVDRHDYDVNFSKSDTKDTDRSLNSVTIGETTIQRSGEASLMYHDQYETSTFTITEGATGIQPKFTVTGTWQHGMVYIDTDGDNQFSVEEMVASSGLTGSPNLETGFSTFNAPAVGTYRIRFKTDWVGDSGTDNGKDPGGRLGTNGTWGESSDNSMKTNRGMIIDMKLVVEASSEPVTDLLEELNAYKESIAPYIGEGLGKFTANDAYTTALATANSMTESNTASEIIAAKNALESAFNALPINQPTTGKYYRIHGMYSDKYLDADYKPTASGKTARVGMSTNSTASSTIWYLDANKSLKSATAGWYITATCDQNGNESNAARYVFEKSESVLGRYYIYSSTNNTNNVFYDNGNSPNNCLDRQGLGRIDQTQNWVIEEVAPEDLPVAITLTYQAGNLSWTTPSVAFIGDYIGDMVESGNCDVDFYTNFVLVNEGASAFVTEEGQNFTISCDDDFPFTVGKFTRIQNTVHADRKDFYVDGSDVKYLTGSTTAGNNSNLWIFEHASTTDPYLFTIKNFGTGKYLTFENTGRNAASAQAEIQGSATEFVNKTSYVYIRKGNGGFCIQHPNDPKTCCSTHITESTKVGGWAPADVTTALNNADNALRVLPIEAFTATLNAVSGDGYYGTIYMEFDMEFDNEVKAYAAYADGNVLKLAEVEGAAPKKKGYVLYKEDENAEGTFTVNVTTAASVSYSGNNDLNGSIVAGKSLPEKDTYTYYALSNKNGIGFYKYNPVTYPTAKAVYRAPTSEVHISAFTFEFEDNPLQTAIQELQKENQEQGTIFDLQGRRIQKVQKGMNIINGRKVLR